MRKILTKKFFNRDTVAVAKDLIGKFLVRKIGNKEIAMMIVETEAYDGENDKASHASKGKTKRTEVMFGHPGYWYVYLIYGMHEMLNIVTREKDYPAAVLIRGVITEDNRHINGPGKLTKLLKISRRLNNTLADKSSGLWLEDRGVKIPKSKIKCSSRIGVNYAGPIWSKKHWRFYLT